MQSRKELRKHNSRNNLYLVIIGVIIIIAIIGGVFIYNKKVKAEQQQRTFAASHFNPNVTIYGIKVGNLTVAKATDKINKKANNIIFLRNKKLVLERDPKIQTIDTQTVKNYFDKQHTNLPNKQKYTYNSTTLNEAKKNLQKMQKATVTYNIAGKSYALKAVDLIGEVTFKDGKYQFTDVKNLTNKLKDIDNEVKTLKKSYKFTVPVGNRINGKTVTVTNKSYGWGVHDKNVQEAVKKAFINGDTTLDGSKYLYGEGFSTYAHGYGKSNNGIGNSYVVVSIKKQELWVVRKGRVVVHLNDVVTGTLKGGKGNRTPKGVWYIMYKQSPSVLRGLNDNGTKYASKVKYWMPFTLSGCGLHDASWRTDWSKTAYLTGGSHGCVNIQPAEIKSVWDNVHTNEAVIIY
ncbi:L,D-transpeptidase [Lactobacillus ultunensis]|uniref:L,D-TPase catalytic domain-containing protein n=1 Tax=Lactobacillus ultunensis DSM 16047 TaxID=525365 RepID=C2EPA4_9LACO|nr:L,D-transpeptidase [Lactobacillus ultunensis]EEJ71647.1 hypothetical protein HMPREF0548_1500 [Lactobacillus ultunensis DSM 16047]KRL80260.1 ErfK YbiS YcfS YnhG family protein [Lactobacillus ultunensis DSM 16047]QQP28419.1 L,D-transpeptidase [Lactobacillus ultunensis]